MWPLGHTVVGPRLVRLLRPRLALGWLAAGGLLPDLVDKPLYYGLVLATGRRGAELGLVSGTRTFGHTGLFLLVFVALALWRRSAVLAAIAWGIASHLFLDNVGDLLGWITTPPEGTTTLHALVFPLLGWRFPVSPFLDVKQHLLSVTRVWVILGELAGALLLVELWWRRRRSD
jgi:hypothetical protein